MNPLTALILDEKYESVKTLITKCKYSLFLKIDNISGFDILIENVVNKNFKNKHKIKELIKFSSKYEKISVKKEFLKSRLANSINLRKKNFYKKLLNVLSFLNDIDKTKLNLSIFLKTFQNVFQLYPKDTISIVRFMIKFNIIENTLNFSDVCNSFEICPKLFGWLRRNFKIEVFKTSVHRQIFKSLFDSIKKSTYTYSKLSEQLGETVNGFKFFAGNDELEHNEINNKFECEVISLLTNKNWIILSECDADILSTVLKFFMDCFGFCVANEVVIEMCKQSSSHLYKLSIAKCFSFLKFTENEQERLFEDFLIAYNNSRKAMSTTYVTEFISLFDYLKQTYYSLWTEILNNNQKEENNENKENKLIKITEHKIEEPEIEDTIIENDYDYNNHDEIPGTDCDEYDNYVKIIDLDGGIYYVNEKIKYMKDKNYGDKWKSVLREMEYQFHCEENKKTSEKQFIKEKNNKIDVNSPTEFIK